MQFDHRVYLRKLSFSTGCQGQTPLASFDKFPCQEFHANWAYLTIGMLAYNIVNWIKRLALPSMYKKKFIKALRYRFFNVAARIVKHSRYIVLKIAQGIHRFTDILHAYERILSLQFQ
ncbi:MAG: hypothetical protein FJ242_05130 [Nitrospira sp.]|nr:hypothetical protein [Nitrospira sp.]